MGGTRRTGFGPVYYAALFGAIFLMASSFIASKILLGADIPPLLLAGWRFLLGSFAALPLVLLAKSPLRTTLTPPHFTFRRWSLVLLIGLLQTAATTGLLFLAMMTISAGTAAILLFTNPLWVALIGHFALRDRLSGWRLGGLICGITGVALALGASGTGLSHEPLAGQLIGLASAICWALATILLKKTRLPINVWALNFWQMFAGALLLLATAYVLGEHWPSAALTPLKLWGCFVWLAVPCSAGAYGLWFVALHRGGATQTSGYLFVVPLFTIVMSALLLGTGISLAQACGGVLVGTALWLVNRPVPGEPALAKAGSATGTTL
jgi:drug/metabolite transporter (DMT)-like permease